MAIDSTILGNRLREARQNSGFTQEEAATAVGIPRTSLLQIEAGKRALTSLELVKLARLYRRDFGLFLGDYAGLAPIGDRFLAVFATTNPNVRNTTRMLAVSGEATP